MTGPLLTKRALLTRSVGLGTGLTAASSAPRVAFSSTRIAAPKLGCKPAPFITDKDYSILNVVNGWTADGYPSDHPMMDYPRTDAALMRAKIISDTVIAITSSAGTFLDDDMQTLIIRKIVALLNETPPRYPSSWFRAADYLARHPEAIPRNLCFRDYELLRIEEIAQEKARLGRPFEDHIALMWSLLDKPPPPPVLWESLDGKVQLVKLLHPFHLWDEAWRGYSRLAETHVPKPRQISRSASTTLQLPYCLQHARSLYVIYSLREPGAYDSLATVIHSQWNTIVCVQNDIAIPHLQDAGSHLKATIDPNHFMATPTFNRDFLQMRKWSATLPWNPSA